MDDSFKSKMQPVTTNNTRTATSNPNEWLKQLEEAGDLIHCKKRSAKMHKKYCHILRKATPVISDSGYLDRSLRQVNICNDCEVTQKYLSVRRFIEARFGIKEEKLDGR